MPDKSFALRPFSPDCAALVVSWVRNANEALRLAPGSRYPFTARTVMSWAQRSGRAFLLTGSTDGRPCAYGELNPMKGDARHLWLGHLLVDPQCRGRGIGRALTRALLQAALVTYDPGKISLVVFPENRSAIRCYEACGLRRAGYERQYFGAPPRAHRLLRFEISKLPLDLLVDNDAAALARPSANRAPMRKSTPTVTRTSQVQPR